MGNLFLAGVQDSKPFVADASIVEDRQFQLIRLPFS
jgi:hypothetical protein